MLNLKTLVTAASMAIAACCAAPAATSPVKSVVVYKACRSMYVAENDMGYVFFEWYGGADPSKGDVIIGEMNGYGFKDVYDLTQDQEIRVWIDDYMLSKSRIIDKITKKCG